MQQMVSCHALCVDVSFCKGLGTLINCVQWVDVSIILFVHITINRCVCFYSLTKLKHV